ncbi:MAG TPA: putative toxin-antitoxin system toxin component, PIN family [Dehalococcoidia bacterium]
MSAVVLDTNIIVAGLLARRGASSALVGALFNDRLQLAYTPEIIGEYAEVLARPEFAHEIEPADRIGLILKMRTSGLLVKPIAVSSVGWPDVDDLPFVAAALATESRIVVTLNPRDFAPAEALGVRVLSPSQARRKLLP